MDVRKSFVGMLVVLFIAIIAVNLTSNLSAIHSGAGGEGITYVGLVCPKVIRSSGEVIDLSCSKNYLMDEGKNFIEQEIGNGTASTNLVDMIFLGNGTSWNTNLATHYDNGEIFECNLGASSVTGKDVGTGNWSYSKVWTSNCAASVVVNTTGLNCSACNANFEWFAGNNFTSPVTLSQNDQINVTWYVYVT